MKLYRSNRTEALARALGELLAQPVGGAFDAEVVVVQGRGMAKWLSMELAKLHGVSANVDFAYPRGFVERAFAATLGEQAVADGMASEQALSWAVLAELDKLLGDERFERLARYVRDDPKGMRLFQLADRIGALFDQYLTYRPQMVLRWEEKDDRDVPAEQRWQPALWRVIAKRFDRRHVARLEQEIGAAIEGGARPEGLPQRLSVFGVTSLPPLFVRVLGTLARFVDTHLFLFSPSAGPWWEIGQTDEPTPQGPVASLLASMAPLGADFRAVVTGELDRLGVRVEEHDLYEPPPAEGLLGRLQRDIYDLAPAPSERAELAPYGDDPAVDTIAVHACHSPMREVEVLHDQLLDLLTRDEATLAPQDVVVLMPDVDGYAPFVEAVFNRDVGTEQFIPFRVADRSVRAESPVIDGFQRLLELSGSRLAASQVLDLLNVSAIAERFAIEPDDVASIMHWVVDAGVRWGFDGAHRELHGQPRVEQNTWRFGLDRLLLGFCMPTGGVADFAGALPYDEIEGKEAELLGDLAHFVETLFSCLETLRAPRDLAAWQVTLGQVLDAMLVQGGDYAWQHQRIRDGLAALATQGAGAGFDGPVDLAVVRELLERHIDTAHPERGFLAGGVTFCAMVPMRSIPFRVVALLGMNDGGFPRSARSVDFDLIHHGPAGPQPGDRDRRKDDRYLFLEALLAARERLIVTYTGQSIRDNSERPASVVVSELLDYAAATYDPAAGYESDKQRRAAVRERLVVRHPLQAFSQSYFDGSDPRLYSYAAAYRRGAEQLCGEREEGAPFFVEPLPTLPEEALEPTLSLAELVRFFEDPVAYLLFRRLTLALRSEDYGVPDREPVELDRLEEYQLGTALLDRALAGLGTDRSYELSSASGALPLGTPGRCRAADLAEPVGAMTAAIAEWTEGGPLGGLEVRQRLPNGVLLTGELGGLYERGQLIYGFAKVKAKRQLAAWVRHLVLAWLAPKGVALRTGIIGRGEKSGMRQVSWGAVKDPADHLTRLVEIYRAGQDAPLRFTPESSYEYAKRIVGEEPAAVALTRARQAFDNRESGFSPHFRRVFGAEGPPFDELAAAPFEYGELALQVCEPLIRALEGKPKKAAPKKAAKTKAKTRARKSTRGGAR
ncbi:MAG: exodeoxyribonuclease V subunit gamma [Deltaproteobacteria bacterium]|jgi:exodeoxyribonuclease V gamma subunit|nr:exodeoxyribonuclease V subunit gamma [Deltaproteobacteria bacterium]